MMRALLIYLLLLVVTPLMAQQDLVPYRNTINVQDEAYKTTSGIIIAGRGDSLRAFSIFSYQKVLALEYASVVNDYRRALDDTISIYCMPVPLQSAFYCPDKASGWVSDQRRCIDEIFSGLSDSVVRVDIYNTLARHASEYIYARTDHHWLPLGAYYACEELARVSDVPFKGLDSYDTLHVRNFVGTMHRFSKVEEVRRHPDTFTYFVPRDVSCRTTQTRYLLDKARKRITRSVGPEDSQYFRRYEDGSRLAYCTFLGGDANNTVLRIDNGMKRRILILKDSFGNALPAFLMYSFGEIHIVDCRYFPGNIRNYIKDNGVTDVVFVNNLQHACSKVIAANYSRYLTQGTR